MEITGPTQEPVPSPFDHPSSASRFQPFTFAVVIPAFNQEHSVRESVLSCVRIGRVREVVVVDDGSTDRTGPIVRAIHDPRVRVVRQHTSGPSSARNTGARAARSSHLVFLDADDTLLSESIELFSSLHARGYRLARSGAVRIAADGSESIQLAETCGYPYPRGTPLAGTFCVDRALFQEVGGYDELLRFGENSEFLMRVQSRLNASGDRVGFCDKPTVSVVANPTHTTAHYRNRRLDAIERMLDVHRLELLRDTETRHNHHAIASLLYHQEGSREQARRHAWAALQLRPISPRSWARFARALLPS